MAVKVSVNNVNLKFRLYRDKGLSLKQYFIEKVKFNREKSKTYEDFYALKNINLNFSEGERVGIIGHNGAGKSTLLKSIARIYVPQEGQIQLSGRVVPLLELGAGFNPEFTGRENIYLNGAMLGVNRDEMSKKEKSIIDFSELEEFIDLPVKNFSSGMYARLAFTVATSIQPEILILDEIFAGGDASFLEKAKKRMNELIEEAKIVFVVSHQLEIIKSICNRVIVLDHGEVSFDGPVNKAIDYYESKIFKK